MPIVIKEVIVRTTIERVANELPVDEQLIRKIKERIKNEIQEENAQTRINRGKNR